MMAHYITLVHHHHHLPLVVVPEGDISGVAGVCRPAVAPASAVADDLDDRHGSMPPYLLQLTARNIAKIAGSG